MTLLVTGGTGFVMSNVILAWLEGDRSARAVSVDLAPPDALAERFFAPVRERVEFVPGDVRDPDLLLQVAERRGVSHIVNGAAITPTVGTTERAQAALTVGVNVMGAVHALELARTLPELRRAIHVSTGSVYGDEGPGDTIALPEEGFVEPFPTTLYPITKLAAELVCRRYRELFDLPLHMVRLASVYGPMDRWTPGRDYACAPNVMVHRAVAGKPWTVAGTAALGDWIHAGDVARAICALLRAETLSHEVYNIAYGAPASLGELSDLVCAAVPGAAWSETADPAAADVSGDPSKRGGAWGAYDIARISADTGWWPQPLGEAIAAYARWVETFESA